MNRHGRRTVTRVDLTRYRGRPTTDKVWILLEADGYPSLEEVPEVARRADQLERILQANPQGRQRRLRGAGLRAEAISCLMAARARKDPDVISFRNERLAGGCVEPSAVQAWIDKQVKFSREKGCTWVGMKLRDGDFTLTPKGGIDIHRHGPFEMSIDPIEYGVCEQQWEVRSAPCCGPALERLRAIAQALSETYWWSTASAATFILTDMPPLVPLATRRLKVNLDMPAVARLGLEVDLSYSPREVAELYRIERNHVLAKTRVRALSEKHMRLALFMADRGLGVDADQPGDETRSYMQAWNKANPKQRYQQLGQFNRDWRAAQERLLETAVVDVSALSPVARMALLIKNPRLRGIEKA
jgi:hypothetical protein